MQSDLLENWVPSYLLLETPKDVCVYCGDQASENDHLIPFSMLTSQTRKGENWGGLMSRSCPSCNRVLSNQYFVTLDRRVAFVSRKISKQLKKIKCSSGWTQREISELSDSLKHLIEAKIRAKQDSERRVLWSKTPAYIDLREKMYEKCLLLYTKNTHLLEFIRPNWVWGISAYGFNHKSP